MKKHLLYILNIIISILFLSSCKDEDVFMPTDDEPCYTILVSVPDEADTRAYYKEDGSDISVVWEKGDVIYLDSYEFVFKEMNGNDALFFHYGSIDNADNWSGTVTFGSDPGSAMQLQKKNNECREYLEANITDASPIDLNSRPTVDLLPADGKSLLHIQAKSPAMFLGGSMLKVTGLDKDYTITLGENSEYVFADEGDQLDIYLIVPSTLSINSGTMLKFYFYAYDENKKSAIDGDEYHYYMKCNAKISAANDKVVKLPLPNKPTHVAIQMGLPSGTKWATMNIGAEKETDYGLYFWWGDVVGYDLNTVFNFWKTNSEIVTCGSPMGKSYETLCDEGIIRGIDSTLVSDYDAAIKHWGNNWRMPTRAECAELHDNTTSNIVTIGAAKGVKLTSKKQGYTNKEVFFCYSGYIENNPQKTAKQGQNSSAHYWSASLSKKLVKEGNVYVSQKAYTFVPGRKVNDDGSRYSGLPIRPVKK